MIKILKICLQKNSIFIKFENPRNFFYKIRELFFCFLFTMYRYKEKILTIKIEDGREAL